MANGGFKRRKVTVYSEDWWETHPPSVPAPPLVDPVTGYYQMCLPMLPLPLDLGVLTIRPKSFTLNEGTQERRGGPPSE